MNLGPSGVLSGLHDPKLMFKRRDAMRLGAAGAAAMVGLGGLPRLARADNPTPTATEGPFWVDERLLRQDVRPDPTTGVVQPGLPLRLEVNVSRLTGGVPSPLVGAWVDIWHCSGAGAYSDEPAGQGNPNTLGQKWLRGYQVTDSHGNVRFITVYPGYYTGRTVHIHARVRLFSGATTTLNFTTQFFFDDTVSNAIFARLSGVYNHGARTTFNTNDNVYSMVAGGGSLLLLRMADDNSHAIGSFNIKLNTGGALVRAYGRDGTELCPEDDHATDLGGGTPTLALRRIITPDQC